MKDAPGPSMGTVLTTPSAAGCIRCTPAALVEISAEILRSGRAVRFQARGDSMSPLVRDGDVLTVHPADAGSIRLGDVVLFTDGHGRPLVHRVIRKVAGREGIHFTVQGDRVSQPDGEIPAARVHGRVTAIERAGVRIDMNQPGLRLLGLVAALRSRWHLNRAHGGSHAYRLAAKLVRRLPAFSKHLA